MRNTAAAKILDELVDEFPDAPALTLAKRAFVRNPGVWPNLEACRSAVRSRLGVYGKKARKEATDKSHFRKPRAAGWHDVIPEPLLPANLWEPVQIDGPHRVGVLSDLHIPFHDKNANEVALDHIERRNPTLILLNGDIADHYAQSFFQTDPRLRDFPEEVRQVKFFLRGLRKRFPRVRLIYKLGNHEERWDRYLRHKAPELLGIDEFDWKNVFALDDYKIELVDSKRPIRLGKLNVIHGHEYRFAISNPVNPARGFYLRGQAHCLGGHFHQTSQHSAKTVEQHVVGAWSTGCLCDLHPEYAPLNNWNHGFAFVTVPKDGAFNVDNYKIIGGKVYQS